MPSSIADLGERWPLSRAVDALAAAARRAGRPGLIWVAGFVYPAVSLAPGFSHEQILGSPQVQLHASDRLEAQLGLSGIVFMLLLPLLARLWVGLARVASPSVWEQASEGRRTPPLRAAWRAGRGVTLSAVGLWLQVMLLWVIAFVVLGVLPTALFTLLFEEVSEAFGVLVVVLFPVVAFLLFYLLLLNLLFQIALHSLAQNRRGSASALTHAWRIARNDPWATARATLVDFLLYVTVLLIALMSIVLLMVTSCVGIPAGFAVLIAAAGFLGVTRACYWAVAYRALGGLSPDDRVPGLDEGQVEPEPA